MLSIVERPLACCCTALLLAVAALLAPAAAGESGGFMQQRAAEKDLLSALEEALGQGHDHEIEDLEELASTLKPTFTSLPRNALGRLESPAVRYLIHSHFIKEHGWLIRGLESQQASEEKKAQNDNSNSKDSAATHGPVEVLYQKAPHYMKSMSAQKKNGFELKDVVVMVALMEHLILDEGIHTLEAAYFVNGLSTKSRISDEDVDPVLESYLLLFAFGNRRDHWNATQHQSDKAKIRKLFPGWADREALARDLHRNLAFPRSHQANPFMPGTFTFKDTTRAMSMLTQQFGKIHDVECRELKDALMDLDSRKNGRLGLGSFYKKGKVGYWHLRESAAYLRHLGILDETAGTGSRGAQVIIPNYVASFANCDAPSAYFSICCMNECEGLLNKIEVNIQAPTATKQQILELVTSLSSSTVEAPRGLSASLADALEQVASLHGGQVPLHGRLFAQWLHYAFPHECPYPHASGVLDQPLSSRDWTRKNRAHASVTKEELEWHESQAQDNTTDSHGRLGDEMAMWTLDEELRAGAGVGMPALAAGGSGGRGVMALVTGSVQIFAAALVLHGLARSVFAALRRRLSGPGPVKVREHLV